MTGAIEDCADVISSGLDLVDQKKVTRCAEMLIERELRFAPT